MSPVSYTHLDVYKRQLEELMEKTILAMRSCEEAVAGETEALCHG